ncbi:G-type lectin S-receptor-like serine/threonine-protein kinase At4g27290 isoform X2 [Syzygium oleosum]|uniref:G-type lectin S-receptor-like serine/threonine-protein kinase At4g27290 isoform X2 n=1 Tax=Syzygium oleosum TaxID=219896 RepID=UPI0024BA4894|nr:G-type lectin S-receptor-like serine/threonine-protein kinase At4g27290 isoform X2 [Syzygium oleosum]
MADPPIFSSFCTSIVLLSLLRLSSAGDTLSSVQSIKEGETLVSQGRKFELGFFSAGSSKNSFLGIWFVVSPETVVWVANRNSPLNDSNGTLEISNEGELVLLNQSKSVIWSTNSTKVMGNPVAQLLDSGNLVLRESNSSDSVDYSWQSFDYPSDTMLDGMTLEWNFRTGLEHHLTSWRSTDDPSPGDYTSGYKIDGLPQVEIVSKGSVKVYRTGPWNGVEFGGIHSDPNIAVKTIAVYNGTGAYLKFETLKDNIIVKFALSSDGVMQVHLLKSGSREWDLMSSLPHDPCDTYGLCGANGVCRVNQTPRCLCLQGFMPKSQEPWDMLNSTEGCIRKITLNCSRQEGFKKLSQVKLPDLVDFQLFKNMSLGECKVECLKNCSCTAYANSDIRGVGCLMWFGDLIDIKEIYAVDNGQYLFLRLPASELDSIHGPSKKLVTIIVASAISGLLVVGMTLSIIWKRRMKRRALVGMTSGTDDIDLPLYDFATVAIATNHFSQTNKLGAGGFGSVYKGSLSTGQEVAVKRLSKFSRQGPDEFMNEVILIARLQHRNLVGLVGCCIDGEERMLIYEYMPNKSLDYFIFDHDGSSSLEWKRRFDIFLGIARGLLYLHQDSKVQVIHRDLKTSNILLDYDMNPKISDFGLARNFQGDDTEAKTRRIVGTYGYMSPEYAFDGKFSVKSDVFSFGVLLLEMVSSQRNRGFQHPDHYHNLLWHAWLLWSEERAMELVDVSLCDSVVESQSERCVQVGLLCVQKFPEDRPTMASVVFMLPNEGATLPQPKEPGFFMERSSGSSDASSVEEEAYTPNVITVTMPEGR